MNYWYAWRARDPSKGQTQDGVNTYAESSPHWFRATGKDELEVDDFRYL